MPQGSTAAGGMAIASTEESKPAGHGGRVEDVEGAGGDNRGAVAVGGSGSVKELICAMPRLQHLMVSPVAMRRLQHLMVSPVAFINFGACTARVELPLTSSYASLPLPLPLPLSFLSATLLSLCPSPSFPNRSSSFSPPLSFLSTPLLSLPPFPFSPPPSPFSPPLSFLSSHVLPHRPSPQVPEPLHAHLAAGLPAAIVVHPLSTGV
ncbi:unnamed protein product [Closterium sp. Yama58-4]|nr:unnamed protein product [Closterium sp. Yama58-4]